MGAGALLPLPLLPAEALMMAKSSSSLITFFPSDFAFEICDVIVAL